MISALKMALQRKGVLPDFTFKYRLSLYSLYPHNTEILLYKLSGQ